MPTTKRASLKSARKWPPSRVNSRCSPGKGDRRGPPVRGRAPRPLRKIPAPRGGGHAPCRGVSKKTISGGKACGFKRRVKPPVRGVFARSPSPGAARWFRVPAPAPPFSKGCPHAPRRLARLLHEHRPSGGRAFDLSAPPRRRGGRQGQTHPRHGCVQRRAVQSGPLPRRRLPARTAWRAPPASGTKSAAACTPSRTSSSRPPYTAFPWPGPKSTARMSPAASARKC